MELSQFSKPILNLCVTCRESELVCLLLLLFVLRREKVALLLNSALPVAAYLPFSKHSKYFNATPTNSQTAVDNARADGVSQRSTVCSL